MDWLNPQEPRITAVEGGALAALLLGLAIVLATCGCTARKESAWQKECHEAREAVRATWAWQNEREWRVNVKDSEWQFGPLRHPGWPAAPKPYGPMEPGQDTKPLYGQEGWAPGEGLAVLVADLSAYWVFQGKVYSANGMAGTWSRGIPWAPVGIDVNSVTRAVQSGQGR